MNNPDDTLAAIDAAVDGWVGRDWTVSPDAMRSAPEPPSVPVSPFRLGHGTASIQTEHGQTGVGSAIPVDLTIQPDCEIFFLLVEQMRRQQEQVRTALRSAGKNFVTMLRRNHVALAPAIYGSDYRRHRRRCRACNPKAGPPPLKVDGAAYARRRKNRRRRAR